MDKQLQDAITQRRAVLNKLKDSLIDRLNLYQNRAQIDDDTPLFGSGLKLDSVDATELVVMLDEEFGIVGWRVVEYPASTTITRAFVETIPTVATATTGTVHSCWAT